MPVSDEKLEEVRKTTKDDNELQELQKYVHRGWPNTPKDLPAMIRPYWNHRDEITVIDGIVFKSQKIIIPEALRSEMLGRIHTGHMGVQKCKERARHRCTRRGGWGGAAAPPILREIIIFEQFLLKYSGNLWG